MLEGLQCSESLLLINVRGPYSPDNCRWATKLEQARNTRKHRYITAFGQTKILSEWAELTGINRTTITNKLKAGLVAEIALSKK